MTRGIPRVNEDIRLGKSKFVILIITLFSIGLLSGALTHHVIQTPGESMEFRYHGESIERKTDIIAVSPNGEGVFAELTIEVTSGKGRILVDTKVLKGFDFQYADRTAVKIAANLAGVPLDDDGVGIKNIDIHFIVSSKNYERVEIQAIDGPSAGATTTILTYAALENKSIREDIVMTGTIREDGSIGLVGGIAAKAMAAEEVGKNLFIVPRGQTVTVYEQRGLITRVRTESISYLQEYAEEQEWNLEIKEVSNIRDAIDLMIY